MTVHKDLYPSDDIGRLRMSIKEGWRRLASIKDSVVASIRRLDDYIKKSKKRLITATRNTSDNIKINKTTIIRWQKCEEKQLYGYFNL